ncbi:Cytochrome c oxidase assembly protein COX15-like [Oopsacas minuta]|uniref:Cytochrome c oxidase assembly protein COX15-like n=1 Tax=Oopsacas minuta TaxID=111878 RepID=A0AAV7JCC3_9METZ|nr:Cytochrome c oxidase assembly protein COX15-like [Oopsacas minuta]
MFHISSLRQLNKIPVLLGRSLRTPALRKSFSSEVAKQSKQDRAIGWWLLGCSGMVMGAVLLGGVTRLTESGLSMVEWNLIKGMRPPRSEEEWNTMFEKYKQFPEYQLLHQDFTLSDFKRIFYMEYAHRMWGRTIGLAFYIPAAIFWYKGWFSRPMKIRSVFWGSLILGQGLLGWWMVKSGLKQIDENDTNAVPRVSQYRLAAHLGLALFLYTLIFYNALKKLLPQSSTTISLSKQVKRLKQGSHTLLLLTYVTALSGALVAGLDAGLVYNSFPKMANKWIPDDILALNPKIKNIFENPTTTQFNHRVLGTTVLGMVAFVWSVARPIGLPPRARLAVNCLAGMAVLQVTLGISTLLAYVPTYLAATHQMGSVSLLSLTVWLMQEIRRIIK